MNAGKDVHTLMRGGASARAGGRSGLRDGAVERARDLGELRGLVPSPLDGRTLCLGLDATEADLLELAGAAMRFLERSAPHCWRRRTVRAIRLAEIVNRAEPDDQEAGSVDRRPRAAAEVPVLGSSLAARADQGAVMTNRVLLDFTRYQRAGHRRQPKRYRPRDRIELAGQQRRDRHHHRHEVAGSSGL